MGRTGIPTRILWKGIKRIQSKQHHYVKVLRMADGVTGFDVLNDVSCRLPTIDCLYNPTSPSCDDSVWELLWPICCHLHSWAMSFFHRDILTSSVCAIIFSRYVVSRVRVAILTVAFINCLPTLQSCNKYGSIIFALEIILLLNINNV